MSVYELSNGTALKTSDDSVMEITTWAQEHLKKSLSV